MKEGKEVQKGIKEVSEVNRRKDKKVVREQRWKINRFEHKCEPTGRRKGSNQTH